MWWDMLGDKKYEGNVFFSSQRLRRLLFIFIALGFAFLIIVLAFNLFSKDKELIPSALIDKQVPEFSLKPLPGENIGFGSLDLRSGKVSIVNIFASWCAPCLIEHPFLMRLSRDYKINIYGINYKDDPQNTIQWLEKNGNPYTAIGVDNNGRVSIDWGVYGIPESFIIDGSGMIRLKHIGPITESDLLEKFIPTIIELNQ